MEEQEAQEKLAAWCEEREDRLTCCRRCLGQLDLDDLPDGVAIQVGTMKDGILRLDGEGMLGRDIGVDCREAGSICGAALSSPRTAPLCLSKNLL